MPQGRFTNKRIVKVRQYINGKWVKTTKEITTTDILTEKHKRNKQDNDSPLPVCTFQTTPVIQTYFDREKQQTVKNVHYVCKLLPPPSPSQQDLPLHQEQPTPQEGHAGRNPSCKPTHPTNILSHSTAGENDKAEANPEKSKQENTYEQRMKKLADSWLACRRDLQHTYMLTHYPHTTTCSLCSSTQKYIIHCPDCGPAAYYCDTCSDRIHQICILHIPLKWTGLLYKEIKWHKEIKIPAHGCPTIPSCMDFIDEKGRQHEVDVHVCQCKTKAETLILLGFWPSSPQQPTTAIHMRFMEKARCFLLEGAVALKKFCDCTKQHLTFLPTYSNSSVDLYRTLSQDCATQHRAFLYELLHLKHMHANFPDGSSCPICEKTKGQLPKIVSMDGNFRLVRKKSAGKSHAEPHHGQLFFLDDDAILPFLPNDPPVSTNACNDFRAGSQGSAIKNDKLDVRGVFGSVCLHDYPQLFVNLQAGEKLGYAVAFINKMLAEERGLKVTYDIACRLKPQLEKAGINPSDIGIAVPIFHGYSHEAKCQVQYNPRLIPGFRNVDGENIERLWSYLGQFTYITKEMTATNRQDLLTDALLHYGEKNITNAVSRLKNRLEAATAEKNKAWESLETAKASLRVAGKVLDKNLLDEWCMNYRELLHDRKKKSPELTWQENYATQLNTYFSLSSRLVEPPVQQDEVERQHEVQKIDANLKKTEATYKIKRWKKESQHFKQHIRLAQTRCAVDIKKRLHREAVERQHLLLLKRDAHGQDSSGKLSRSINSVNNRLEKLVSMYNKVDLENPITFDTVKDTEANIYKDLSTSIDVPYALLKEVVMSSNRMKRCNEELAAIEIELQALLQHKRDLHQLLENILLRDLNVGEKAFVYKMMYNNEREQLLTSVAMNRIFQVETPVIDRNFSNLLKEVVTALTNGSEDFKDDTSEELSFTEDEDCFFVSSEEENLM